MPSKPTFKTLYNISEKIRYEKLGTKILNGVSKNLIDNYNYKISMKRKDQLKSKEDTTISEAFEIYMLKNFLNIKPNVMCEKILSFWEDEFRKSFGKHLNYLKENLENQQLYSSKFFEILNELDFLEKDEDEKMKKINKIMSKIISKVQSQKMKQMKIKNKMKLKINLYQMLI